MKVRIKTICPMCESSVTTEHTILSVPDFGDAVEFFADTAICPTCGKPWNAISAITLLDPTGDSYDILLYKGPLT